MRLSKTLSFYIGRHFLMSFLYVLGAFLLLIVLLDTIELLRRSSAKPDVTFIMVIQMALLKLPHMGQMTFPFAALFGGMVAFWRLTRSQELAITRAAGISAWQFLLPVLVLAIALGGLRIGAINPLASALLSNYERMEAVLLKGQKSSLALSPSGLWLRQGGLDGQAVVHAAYVLQQGSDVELTNVSVFLYRGADTFQSRMEAATATLEDGRWRMMDTWIYAPETPPEHRDVHYLSTDLTLGKIQDNFARPEALSFWDLPGFIDTLEDAGFSAIRHKLHWHALLASPLLMCAMVLIAATFTLRHSRRGGATFIITTGVMTGFLLFFFSDVVLALGMSDSIPVTLAAWAPSGVSMMLGLAMLLHLEDG